MFLTSILTSVALIQAASLELSTPEKSVRTFVAQVNAGSAQRAYQCLSTTKPMDKQAPMFFMGLKSSLGKIKIEELFSDTKGTRASVFVRLAPIAGIPKMPPTETLLLVRESNKWRIVAQRLDGDRKDEVLNGMADLLVNGLQDVFGRAKEAAQKKAVLSNAKKLAIAAMLYAGEHRDKFPPKGDWKKALMPYAKAESLFHAPGIKTSDKYSDFDFNVAVMGVELKRISRPAETVMLYLGKSGKINYHYSGLTVVVYCDAHVKLLTADGAKKLRWKP